MIDDLTDIIKHESETCNGVPIERFRELASKRYPFVTGGIYIDPKVVATCTPNGRIFLNHDISTDTVARFPLDGIEVDKTTAGWLCFLHEIAHLKLNHIKNNASPSEILHAQRRMKNLTMQEKEIYASVVSQNQNEADRWADAPLRPTLIFIMFVHFTTNSESYVKWTRNFYQPAKEIIKWLREKTIWKTNLILFRLVILTCKITMP